MTLKIGQIYEFEFNLSKDTGIGRYIGQYTSVTDKIEHIFEILENHCIGVPYQYMVNDNPTLYEKQIPVIQAFNSNTSLESKFFIREEKEIITEGRGKKILIIGLNYSYV